jgi:hypothetical protein
MGIFSDFERFWPAKNKANQACPFGKLKAGSEHRRMEPNSNGMSAFLLMA